MKSRYFLVTALWLLITSCLRMDEWYAPPVPRKPMTGPVVSPVRHFVNMNDPHAEDYFVRDISDTLEGNAFRWTRQRPALRFVLQSTENLRFVMDFFLSPDNMKVTGPVTISYYINNHLLDRVRYEKPGVLHFEKPVNPEWLTAGTETLVVAELDKVYIAPADKAVLGMVLTRAGFLD